MLEILKTKTTADYNAMGEFITENMQRFGAF
jgi:hypothetical protein